MSSRYAYPEVSQNHLAGGVEARCLLRALYVDGHQVIGRIGPDVCGAVGVLQFDVVVARLKSEYNVEAIYESVNVATA